MKMTEGLNYNRALAVERYRFGEREGRMGKIRLCLYEFFNLLRWNGVGGTRGSARLCFFQGMRRADYDRLFESVCGSYSGTAIVWRPRFAKFLCPKGLVAAWEGLRFWRSLEASSFLERFFLYSLSSRGRSLVGEVGEARLLGLVVFSDMQFLDGLLVEHFRGRGLVTASLQHALYRDLGYDPCRNSMNYLGSHSDLILCWGEESAALFQKYRGDSAEVYVVGNPSLVPVERMSSAQRWFTLVLDYDDNVVANRELIRLGILFARDANCSVNVRLHPRSDRTLYDFSSCEASEGLAIEDSKFVLGHSSTILYEFAARGLPVLVYKSGGATISELEPYQFTDYARLISLSEQVEEGVEFGFSERYITAIGDRSRDLYRTALDAFFGKGKSDRCRKSVSVITATYDSLVTLQRTVESVRDQAGVEIEHIIIDGGSNDGTANWLKENCSPDTWISESDEGIADAMNKGVELAKGDWLLFLQADDWLVSGDRLCAALEAWDGESELIASPILFESGRLLEPRCDRGYFRWFKQGVLHQGALIRRSLFERIGKYDTSYRVTMDFDWFLRAQFSGAVIQVLEEPLAVMGESGVSSRVDWLSLRNRLREEQRSRLVNSPNLVWRICYRFYWPLYLFYSYTKQRLRRR